MIIVKGRELLIPENERYIGTTYDDNSTVRTFRIPRFHEDGMDKSQLDFYVIINYDDGSDPDAVGVTKSVSDDYIVLEWDVGEDITEHSGCLFLWVRGFDYTGAVRWSSFPGVFYIEGSGTEPSDLSDLEQRISEEDKLLRLAKLYKSQPMTAKTVAEMKYRDRIYVYVGSEEGYTYGDWYFWDEDQMAWVSGGIYNAAGTETDKTLTREDFAADAAEVGKRVDWFVTPEMFGAKGDGTTDDTNAFKLMLADARNIIYIPDKSYKISEPILVDVNKTIKSDNTTFPNLKPVWSRPFDLEQLSLFGLAKEFELNLTDSYGEALTYDSTRNKIYVGIRNYGVDPETTTVMIFNASTLEYETSNIFTISAIASMSYCAENDKLYVVTTGSGNGKTNALYTISVASWTLDGEITTPNNNQFIGYDPVAKLFVLCYINVLNGNNRASIRVYDPTLTTSLKAFSVPLESTDTPQQGFCVYDGHIYTPTFNTILEIDYISGEVNRLTYFSANTNTEEMESLTVVDGKILAFSHRSGDTTTPYKERIYQYGYSSNKNFGTVDSPVIYVDKEVVTSSISVAAGAQTKSPTFTIPTVPGYTAMGVSIYSALGPGAGNFLFTVSLASNQVNIFNAHATTTITLNSLTLRYMFVRDDLYRTY